MTAPWFKMYRDERGSFMRLPLVARALFGEILKMTDDEGRIPLHGETPAAAVARTLGADRSDRRALRKHIPLLLEDGCLRVSDGVLFAPGWSKFQPPRAAPEEGEDHDQTATSTTNEPRPVPRPDRDQYHENQVKPPESFNSGPVEVEVEVEDTHSACAREPGNRPQFQDPLNELGKVSAGRLPTRLWGLAMRDLSPKPWDESLLRGSDIERLRQITDWAVATANVAERQGGDWGKTYLEALHRSLIAFRDEYQERPSTTPLCPGGWWVRREKWRQAS